MEELQKQYEFWLRVWTRIVLGVILILAIIIGGITLDNYNTRKLAEKGFCYEPAIGGSSHFEKCKTNE